MSQQNKVLKKASSLIEVIIVLAIVSFTIIASMALVAKTRLEIKNNELQDNANEVLLKALEALKSPSKVVLVNSPALTGAGPYYFALKEDQSGNYVLNYQYPGQFTSLPKTDNTFDIPYIVYSTDVVDLFGRELNPSTNAPISAAAKLRSGYDVRTKKVSVRINNDDGLTTRAFRANLKIG